jgi:chromosome segregation ATPase
MGTLSRPEDHKMWKWIGYITAVLPLIGVLYGGLRITSDLQTSLEQSIQTSADAHARIDYIAQSQKDINKQLLDLQSISAEVNGIVGSLERQKNDTVTRGQLETLRDQIAALRESISTEVNGIVVSLERQKNDTVTRGQLDTLRDQISGLRNTLEQMRDTSNKVSDIYSRLDKIEREVNNTRIDGDKRIHNALKDIEEIYRRIDRANID